ncbi:MAG: hypothetical protein ACYTX0_25095 [Nostoc sp.]
MAIGDRPSICAEYKRGNVSPRGDALLYETLRERRRLRVRPTAASYACRAFYLTVWSKDWVFD